MKKKRGKKPDVQARQDRDIESSNEEKRKKAKLECKGGSQSFSVKAVRRSVVTAPMTITQPRHLSIHDCKILQITDWRNIHQVR